MSASNRPDFCFNRTVLASVDASDICEAFGLVDSTDTDDEDLFDDEVVQEVTRRYRNDRMSEATGSLMDLL